MAETRALGMESCPPARPGPAVPSTGTAGHRGQGCRPGPPAQAPPGPLQPWTRGGKGGLDGARGRPPLSACRGGRGASQPLCPLGRLLLAALAGSRDRTWWVLLVLVGWLLLGS